MPKCPRKWDILAFLHQFGHVLVANAKMSHFERGKIIWTILASVKVFNQVTYLCHSYFWLFWQPSRTSSPDRRWKNHKKYLVGFLWDGCQWRWFCQSHFVEWCCKSINLGFSIFQNFFIIWNHLINCFYSSLLTGSFFSLFCQQNFQICQGRI